MDGFVCFVQIVTRPMKISYMSANMHTLINTFSFESGESRLTVVSREAKKKQHAWPTRPLQ